MSSKPRFKLPQTYHSPQSLPSLKISNSLLFSDSQSYKKNVLVPITNKAEGTESAWKIGLGSIEEYMSHRLPNLSRVPTKKEKPRLLQPKLIDQMTADRILTGEDKKNQKIKACKVIAQSLFLKVYGREVARVQMELPKQIENKNPGNLINMGILQEIMKEMEFNPRSHSVMLRKEELERVCTEYPRAFHQEHQLKPSSTFESKAEGRIQIFYRIKNQYGSLRSMIIPTRSQQYDDFLEQYSQQTYAKHNDSKLENISRKKTFLITELNKENQDNNYRKQHRQSESFQKFRGFRSSALMMKQCPSKFEKTNERLIIENIMEMRPSVFLYMVNHCCFELLKIIRFRFMRLTDDLLFFFIDCLRQTGPRAPALQSLEISSMLVQNLTKFSDKLAQLFQQIPIRALRLQSLDFGTRELSTICAGLSKTEHFRNYRCGTTVLIFWECEAFSGLRLLDVRNNDIPHYANLKDKSRRILFF